MSVQHSKLNLHLLPIIDYEQAVNFSESPKIEESDPSKSIKARDTYDGDLLPPKIDEDFIRGRGAYGHTDLQGRLKILTLQEKGLADATAHQTRDRLICCAIVAIAIGSIAAMVFGSAPFLIAGAVLLGALVISCAYTASNINQIDGLPQYKIFSSFNGGAGQGFAIILGVIPITIYSLFSRKSRIEKHRQELENQVKNEFIAQGEFFRSNRENLIRVVNDQIALREGFLKERRGRINEVRAINKELRSARDLLIQLEGPAKELVDNLESAGLLGDLSAGDH